MVDGRRTLPAIPLTTTISCQQQPQPQQQQQQQQHPVASPRWSSTSFNDDGHYAAIHLNSGGGGTTRIPSWRRSFDDVPDHYNFIELENQVTGNGSTVEQLPRSTEGDDEGLHQPSSSTQNQYVGIESDQPWSRTHQKGHMEPIQQSEGGNRGMVEELQQPPRSAVPTVGQHQGGGSRQGYEGLDPSIVERAQLPHSYSGTSPSTGASGLRGNLEVAGYAGIGNFDDSGTAAGHSEGVDPAEVEELRRRTNIPQTDGINRERQGEVTESKGYEGLDPGEVEAFRQQAGQLRGGAGLGNNIEDLYSRPIKKRRHKTCRKSYWSDTLYLTFNYV